MNLDTQSFQPIINFILVYVDRTINMKHPQIKRETQRNEHTHEKQYSRLSSHHVTNA